MYINLFQLEPDGISTLSAISEDAGWVVLRPLAGEGQDWHEYDIIRHYFMHHPVEDDALYGFLLPNFFKETHLSETEITHFIMQYPNQDAYVFPAHIESAVCYWNVFEQGERIAPGLQQIAQTLLQEWDIDVSLATLAMPLNRTAHQYYLIARPAIWRQWLKLADRVMHIVHQPDHALSAALLEQVSVQGTKMPLYRLVIERLLSLVLSQDQSIRSTAYDVYVMPCLDKTFLPYMTYVSSLDTLKKAYQVSRQQKHYDNFLSLRKIIADRHLHKQLALSQRATVTPFICLTEQEVAITYPILVKPLYIGDVPKKQEGDLTLKELAPEWEKWYPALGELVGLIAYKNYIVNYFPTAKRIGLCQPQKFIAKSPKNQAIDVVSLSPHLLSTHAYTPDVLKEMMLPEHVDLLVGEPVSFMHHQGKRTYLEDFGQMYCVEDLLRFTDIAVDFGILDPSDKVLFLQETSFYRSSCQLGIFPTEFWIQTISAVESLVRKCLLQLPASDSTYQRSAWTMCAQYLMSYLLHQYIVMHYPDESSRMQCYGQCILVTDLVVNPLPVSSL